MKNKIRVSVYSALLIGSLAGGLGTGELTAHASNNDVNIKVAQQVVGQFKDVSKNHYAYEAIEWAKAKGIVSGYTDAKGKPNGLFAPNDDVTEAQFVKMVAEYFGLKDDSGDITKKGVSASKTHWADSNYDALAKYGVPLNGYFDNTVRNKAVKRGTVAQVLGYLMGDTSSLSGSINFLINNGITTGQNPEFESKDLNKFFGSSNNLTRGQVVAFLHRIDTKNLNKLGQGSSAYAEVAQDLNSKANSASGMIDSLLSGKPSTSTNTGANNGNGSSTGGSGIVLIPGNNDNGSTTVCGNDSNNTVKETAAYYKEKGVKVDVRTTSSHNVDNILAFEKKLSSNTISLMNKAGLQYFDTKDEGYVALNDGTTTGLANKINIDYNKNIVKSFTSEYEMLSSVLKDIYGLNITPSNLKSKILNAKMDTAIQFGNGVTFTRLNNIYTFTKN